jgi:hypothetical protein
MERQSGGIPERHGTGLVRWGARLVLFLLAAGVLFLLGDGRATATPSQHRSVAVSLDTQRGAPARVARELGSGATRAARRLAAIPRRHSTATACAASPATRSFDQVTERAGRGVGRVAQASAGQAVGAATRRVGQPVGGATRQRVDAALAPVTETLGPILGPLAQPVVAALDGLPRRTGVPPDLTQPPRTAPAASSAREHDARDPARGDGPAAAGTVLLAGHGLAGSLAAAGRMAIGTATGREPRPGKTAPTSGIPAPPASASATRDTSTASLAAALLPLLLVLLWSVSFGKDGTRHRTRPPLLFPA